MKVKITFKSGRWVTMDYSKDTDFKEWLKEILKGRRFCCNSSSAINVNEIESIVLLKEDRAGD